MTAAHLVPLQPSGDRPPLYLAHALGGDVRMYAALAEELGPGQPVYGLQAVPGYHSEALSIPDMAAEYLEEIRELQPRGPYFVGGFSFGGRVAYELAQQLVRCSEEVAFLGLIDTIIHPIARQSDFPAYLELFDELDDRPPGLGGRWLPRHLAKVVSSVWTRRSRNRTTRRIDRDWIAAQPEEWRRLAQAQYAAAQAHSPRAYPGPVTLFRARQQPVAVRDDPTNGWAAFVTGDLTVRSVPGNHLTLLGRSNAPTLAREMRRALQEASARAERNHPGPPFRAAPGQSTR